MKELIQTEEFEQALRRHGLRSEDFMVRKDRDARLSSADYPGTGTVTVTARRTGVQRVYRFGGGPWLEDLERDLAANAFGL